MPTVEDTFTVVAREKIAQGAQFTAQEMDPFFAMVKRSAKGVTPIGIESGNGFSFQKVVGLGMGGALRHVGTVGPATLNTADPMTFLNEMQTFPAATESVIPGYKRMKGFLSQLRGNIALELQMLRMNAIGDLVTDVINDVLDGVSMRITLHRLASFYTPSTLTKHICEVTNWTVSGTPSGSIGSFIPKERNEMLFHEGHILQFYSSNGTNVGCRHTATGQDDPAVRCIVRSVDNITQKVEVYVADGSNKLAISGNAVADGDIVVHHGQLSGGNGIGSSPTGTPVAHGAYGLVDWLINTGFILGVDTSQFHRLKSVKTPDLDGPWTEEEADKHLMWYSRWHRRFPITDLFMTGGAILSHKKTMLGIFRADRTGKPVEIVGGHTSISHVHNGRTVNYHETPYMRKGFIVGLYLTNNFQMLHPPAPQNVPTTSERMGNDVEFLLGGTAPGQGPKSIFRSVSWCPPGGGAAEPTLTLEAPFIIWYNLWPMRHLPGIMVGGVSETNWSSS